MEPDRPLGDIPTSHEQLTLPSAHAESANAAKTQPEQTAELLSELVALIRQGSKPDESASTCWAQIKKAFEALTDTIQHYWVWLPIIGFLLAWWYYQFNPFYIFDQYKIASDESAAKMANIAHKKNARVLHSFGESIAK